MTETPSYKYFDSNTEQPSSILLQQFDSQTQCKNRSSDTAISAKSLFSMASMENTQHQLHQMNHYHHQPSSRLPTENDLLTLHDQNLSVDEYKDWSLRQLLDASKNFLCDGQEDDDNIDGNFDDDDSPLPAAVDRGDSTSLLDPTTPSSSLLDPTPLNAPNLDYTVAQVSHQQQVINSAITKTGQEETAAHPIKTANMKRQFQEEEDGEDNMIAKCSSNRPRFRSYQAGDWSDRCAELVNYRIRFGNCLVAHTFHENMPLSHWVKRQRYQYRLAQEGKPSTMTPDRISALESIGFVWDTQGANWGEHWGELREYALTFGNCNVPTHYKENPKLATWVKCQRRQYKLFMARKPSNMTPQRIRDLKAIGFEWLLRSSKKARHV